MPNALDITFTQPPERNMFAVPCSRISLVRIMNSRNSPCPTCALNHQLYVLKCHSYTYYQWIFKFKLNLDLNLSLWEILFSQRVMGSLNLVCVKPTERTYLTILFYCLKSSAIIIVFNLTRVSTNKQYRIKYVSTWYLMS